MKKKFQQPLAILVLLFFGLNQNLFGQIGESEPTMIGAMKNVMWKGQLQGTIMLDTIPNKMHLYGMGPLSYLKGELLVMDGVVYKSMVVDKNTMLVEETSEASAPFFAYANIGKWVDQKLPDSIQTLRQIENYLNRLNGPSKVPFMFKLQGDIISAKIHIVNLPDGAIVKSPEDAHQGKIVYHVANETVDVLGFYSTQHQTIFTHKDTFIHTHLINKNKDKMGHLDEVKFKKGTVVLSLPQQ